MVNEELARARVELQRLGADWAILTSPELVIMPVTASARP
jgi:hypothetical protein